MVDLTHSVDVFVMHSSAMSVVLAGGPATALNGTKHGFWMEETDLVMLAIVFSNHLRTEMFLGDKFCSDST